HWFEYIKYKARVFKSEGEWGWEGCKGEAKFDKDKAKNGVAPSTKEMNEANNDGVAPFVIVASRDSTSTQ
ncbi:hypothetical protein Tco_0515822, partial [Tanacetum coccineum]